MIKNMLGAFAGSIRNLFRRWPALLMLILIYAALLFAGFLFFSTRVATVGQVALSFVAPAVALILFFVVQLMSARLGIETRSGRLLASAFRGFWALLLISVPIVLLAWLIIYLSGQVEESLAKTVRNLPARLRNPARPAAQAVPWQVTLTNTVENVMLLVVLPLAAIHLWIGTAREGLAVAIKESARTLGRAFAPRSVLTYLAGCIFFAVIPYFLVFTKTPASNAWIEAGLLGLRLVMAALFSLIGWVVTVGALAELRSGGADRDLQRGAEHAPVST